jgi:rare lipoprotein A
MLLLASALITGACARRSAARIPMPAKIGSTETGTASWYGDPYNGRRAASGEIYDMRQLTAAHRTLPFGTWVRVDDLDNGKQVDVRINDRGPFVDGRIIDLSLEAARQIKMVGPGTARVRLKVIAAPNPTPQPAASQPAAPRPVASPTPTLPYTSPDIAPDISLENRYAVEAGAFSARERADALQAAIQKNFEETRVVQASSVWLVLVGRQLTRDAANELVGKVRAAAGEAIIVPDR